jgi:uncharacterized membrane protein YhaH (DUF805 family)
MDTIVSQALQRCMDEVETNPCIQRGKDRAVTVITVSIGSLAMVIVMLALILRKLHTLSRQIKCSPL